MPRKMMGEKNNEKLDFWIPIVVAFRSIALTVQAHAKNPLQRTDEIVLY